VIVYLALQTARTLVKSGFERSIQGLVQVLGLGGWHDPSRNVLAAA